jgi:ribosome-associated heat shock protein Hsp15
LRLDLALFELRLFRSRSQAQTAIADGRALLNGERVRPSHELRAGDRVTLRSGDREHTVEVLELPAKSLSREQARALVRDLG